MTRRRTFISPAKRKSRNGIFVTFARPLGAAGVSCSSSEGPQIECTELGGGALSRRLSSANAPPSSRSFLLSPVKDASSFKSCKTSSSSKEPLPPPSSFGTVTELRRSHGRIKRDKLNGTNWFLRKSAVFCENLRLPAVFCNSQEPRGPES